MGRASTLIVSMLPRGEPGGGSALVALDADLLEPVSTRPFAAAEYLRDPKDPSSPSIEHCRGMAQADGNLYVALFNGVRVYRVLDGRRLFLESLGLLTHPRAVDLHGIDARDGVLYAASTGSDAVISWSLASREAEVVAFGSGDDRDVRFPHRLASCLDKKDWRDVLAAELHLNDVARGDSGEMVVCSLKRAFAVADGRVRTLLEDRGALFHDGRFISDGRLLFTDAARGELILVDPAGGRPSRIVIADCDAWFVRGICLLDDHVVILRSELVATRQRDPVRHKVERGSPSSGGRFGVTVVDIVSGRRSLEKIVEPAGLGLGSVAYAILDWPQAA